MRMEKQSVATNDTVLPGESCAIESASLLLEIQSLNRIVTTEDFDDGILDFNLSDPFKLIANGIGRNNPSDNSVPGKRPSPSQESQNAPESVILPNEPSPTERQTHRERREAMDAHSVAMKEENPFKNILRRVLPDPLADIIGEGLKHYVEGLVAEDNERRQDFANRFGDEVADQLMKMGCRKIEINGNTIAMKFNSELTFPINQNGLKSVIVERDVKFEVQRQGDAIEIKNVEGIKLDHSRFFRNITVPDTTLAPDGSAKTWVGKFPIPAEIYNRVNDLLKKQGR
ncbi:MAG: hypothetical protein K2W95_34330 [Candidatus Obscuribacterales bacterium]|nr:hypothetical protein [Candidatus Obscuribacterales bacterium]